MTTRRGSEPTAPVDETDMRSSHRRSMRWLRWFFGLALVAVVIVVARHFSEAKDFALHVEHAEPSWLLVAVLLQAGTYVCQGQVFRSVAAAVRFPLSIGKACRLSLAKLFVNQAIPSGSVSGNDRARERVVVGPIDERSRSIPQRSVVEPPSWPTARSPAHS